MVARFTQHRTLRCLALRSLCTQRTDSPIDVPGRVGNDLHDALLGKQRLYRTDKYRPKINGNCKSADRFVLVAEVSSELETKLRIIRRIHCERVHSHVIIAPEPKSLCCLWPRVAGRYRSRQDCWIFLRPFPPSSLSLYLLPYSDPYPVLQIKTRPEMLRTFSSHL